MIEILIGNIASGKSTYSAWRADQGAIIINDDAIVSAFHAGKNHLHAKALKPLYKRAELNAIIDAVMLGIDVIIDRGSNVSPLCRKKYLGLATALEQKVVAVVFPYADPAKLALRRHLADTRGRTLKHWEEVAQRFFHEYVSPTTAEGFDDIVSVDALWPSFSDHSKE